VVVVVFESERGEEVLGYGWTVELEGDMRARRKKDGSGSIIEGRKVLLKGRWEEERRSVDGLDEDGTKGREREGEGKKKERVSWGEQMVVGEEGPARLLKVGNTSSETRDGRSGSSFCSVFSSFLFSERMGEESMTFILCIFESNTKEGATKIATEQERNRTLSSSRPFPSCSFFFSELEQTETKKRERGEKSN